MPDREESHRPQDRDFTIDQWDKFPFKRKDDPYENRSEARADKEDQSQYEYEGWEHNAFTTEDVYEEPATGAQDEKAGEDVSVTVPRGMLSVTVSESQRNHEVPGRISRAD